MTLVLVALLMAAGADAGKTPCPILEAGLMRELSTSQVRMEPEIARASVGEKAAEALKHCPNSEPIAYVCARAAELGTRVLSSDESRDAHDLDVVRSTAKAFPNSVRIATIRSRIDGTLESARAAAALDPSYAPAQVALASALLASGDTAGGRKAIEGVKDLAALDDGYAVLARIKWAAGDVAGAKQAANLELKGRRSEGGEPGGIGTRGIAQAHEVLALVAIKARKWNEAASHLLLADRESKTVRELLDRPEPHLKRALAKRQRRH